MKIMFPHSIPQTIARFGVMAATGLTLSACATATTTQSGFLSSYDQLEPRTDVVRARVSQFRDEPVLGTIERVVLEPAVLGLGVADDFKPEDRQALLHEMDRQVCYKVSRVFTIAPADDREAARLRVAATRVVPTNAVGSTASAIVGQFIPGPIGLRIPGSTGGLAAEAELVTSDGRQVAAIVWAREAQVVGTENPSLSRVGDAHQLSGAFADVVAQAIAPEEQTSRPLPDPDPCQAYGPRIKPEGFIARFVTGLYSPTLSGGTNANEAPPIEPSEPDVD